MMLEIIGEACPIAREINDLHSELDSLCKTVLEKALRVGELLVRQKESLKHGQWLAWLVANIRFSQKTAWNYIRLFETRDDPRLVNVTSLRDRLALIGKKVLSTNRAEPECDYNRNHRRDTGVLPEPSKVQKQGNNQDARDTGCETTNPFDECADEPLTALVEKKPAEQGECGLELAEGLRNHIDIKAREMRQELQEWGLSDDVLAAARLYALEAFSAALR